MDNFTNQVIELNQLPQYQSVELTPIMPDYWKVIQINIFLTFFILAFGMGLIFYKIENPLPPIAWSIIPGFVLLLGAVYFTSKLSFKKRSYAIRKHDIIFQNGILSTTSIIIPFQRIQHIAINEGLLSRHYGLAQLRIFTAGGVSSDVKIPGLLKQDAERIKEHLLHEINSLTAEESLPTQDPD